MPKEAFIRLRITYDWSELQKRQALDEDWVEYMQQDLNEFGWLDDYIKKFEEPFLNLPQRING